MKKPKIIVHLLVKNEERFIWYGINSVLPFVDKIMVWDTGSTDDTVKIVKSIKSPKISFKEVGSVDAETFTAIRQQMLDETPSEYDWVLMMGGDEVWSDSALSKAIETIKENPDLEIVVVRTHNLVGDIYHRQTESGGHYSLAGMTGHLSMPLVNLRIPGLHFGQPYGFEGFYDEDSTPIQDRKSNKIKFVNVYYHHATHLQRSRFDRAVMQRGTKHKYELGSTIPQSEITDIFLKSHPDFVPAVTNRAPLTFWLRATIQTPLKMIKRLLSLQDK